MPLRVRPAANPVVHGVAYDSRRVQPGDVFVAVSGDHTDGHQHVAGALGAGAVAAIVERDVPGAGPLVVVDDTRLVLALVAANLHGHPGRELRVVGVTGTDGKTTTTVLLHAILQHARPPAGAMTTVDHRLGGEVFGNQSRQTTLEAPEIQALLARMRDSEIGDVVLETSSHGLALHRVAGCEYDVAVFTNIAHEHLDFHGTLEAYQEAKASLIDITAGAADKGILKTAVLNRDDPSFEFLEPRPIARRITYGRAPGSDLQLRAVEPHPGGLRLRARAPGGDLEVGLRLLGSWNAHNALAAAGGALALGVEPDTIVRGLESVEAVPGRMERVDAGQPFTVVVDYAHTPQSLEKVLRELRPITAGRLIVVFGSAGERDREKRPIMGEIAARNADHAVLTDEDPRDEDPWQVIAEVAAGAEAAGARDGLDFARIQDRREAIAYAIAMARPGDTVLLAGKGHEHSIIGPGLQASPWDERAEALAALASPGHTS